MTTIFYGALVSPTSLTSYDALPRALLAVSRESGDIAWVERDVAPEGLQDALALHGVLGEDADVVALKHGEFLMPGLIDTHIHAPQMPNIGSGQQYELLEWLAEVTFPMEARFADVGFARKAYASVIRRTLDYGSTTCCYYGTLHLEGTKALADAVHSFGQRAFVGKCNMDRNAPDYYVEPSAAESLTATTALIEHIRALPPPPVGGGAPLVRPILTPRFAIACTPQLLEGLGALAAADPALAIQTHVAENAGEIAFTRELFPPSALPEGSAARVRAEGAGTGGVAYTEVYDAFGLLRGNTVLAHAVHLAEAEVTLIKERGAGVSHCPTSNFNLRSGCAHVGMLLDRGIKVGLGTDVSGGFTPSILAAVQHASMCSKVVALQAQAAAAVDGASSTNTGFSGRQLPVPALLYLATRGGAEVCGLQARVGALAPGMAFDALVASVRDDAGNPALWGVDMDAALGGRGTGKGAKEELEGMLERFLFCGDDRNIRRVYVQGRLVGGKEFAK